MAMGPPEISNFIAVSMILPIAIAVIVIIVLLIIIFAVILPSSKRKKQRDIMLASMRVGDRVVAANGARGQIVNIFNNDITILLDGQNVPMVFPRSAILKVE